MNGQPPVFTESGDNGDQWMLGQANIDTSSSYKVKIIATIGGDLSDIAIDDIYNSPQSCQLGGKLSRMAEKV